jgi:hypothetical protein
MKLMLVGFFFHNFQVGYYCFSKFGCQFVFFFSFFRKGIIGIFLPLFIETCGKEVLQNV